MLEQRNSTEAELVSLLEQQGQLYNEAIQLVKRISPANIDQSLRVSEITGKVRQLMIKVDAMGPHISNLRQQLLTSGTPRSPHLKATVDRQEQLLKEFISEIDRSKNTVNGRRADLVPSLDSKGQRSSMQSAYRVSMRTG
ncbi:MAG: hypothetical protein WAO83_15285 [Fuerstiella sp.]